MENERTVNPGDQVTTRFGEVLEVLEVKTIPGRTKKGEVVAEPVTMFLAKSGEQNCWFPLSHLKGEDN